MGKWLQTILELTQIDDFREFSNSETDKAYYPGNNLIGTQETIKKNSDNLDAFDCNWPLHMFADC